MNISVNERYHFELKEVYVPIILRNDSGDSISICMRDSGFELKYKGELFEVKNGDITKLNIPNLGDAQLLQVGTTGNSENDQNK